MTCRPGFPALRTHRSTATYVANPGGGDGGEGEHACGHQLDERANYRRWATAGATKRRLSRQAPRRRRDVAVATWLRPAFLATYIASSAARIKPSSSTSGPGLVATPTLALGHAAGDELLCIMATRFEHQLGDRGVLSRLGGDEYAFACPVEQETDMVVIAHKLLPVLSDPCLLDGVSVRVGASIGVVASLPDGATTGELLRCADVAMYDAKRTQSGVSAYRAGTDPNSRDRLALLDALRDAINNGELVLYYQPTLDMRTATVRGVEALVRWPHPTLGLLYPDSFIPLAERNGLMPQLTRAVLEMAVAEAARLDRAGRRIQMSVNISRHDLVDEDLAGYVDQVLARHEVAHDRLTLEITESALGGDPERAERCVAQLRARGLRVSIDDYGVGYSSMSQLLGLAIDELKIDKSFIIGPNSDPRAQAIVRSAIELARALDVTVVAEGVETEEVLRSLQSIGADIGQGYVIARPLTSGQLDDYLAQQGPARRPPPDLKSATVKVMAREPR